MIVAAIKRQPKISGVHSYKFHGASLKKDIVPRKQLVPLVNDI